MILYDDVWGGLMSWLWCSCYKWSWGKIILLQTHRDSAEIKTPSSDNIKPTSYVTGQSSHLTTNISHSWVEWFYSVLGEQQGVVNNWNGILAFWIDAANHMCRTHVTDNQAKALEDCKNKVSCEVYNLNAQDVAKYLNMHM